MTWFTDRRQRWISETIRIFEFINREHIIRKFGVSIPQASCDLKEFQLKNPNVITYNKTTKRYEINYIHHKED